MKKLILSASSISAFKSCPIRFRNAYVYGIRPIEDKESQRVGSNWHSILEVASLVPGSDCSWCGGDVETNAVQVCLVCEGTGKVPGDIMEAVTRVLNKAYEGIEFADPAAKEVERVTLLHALAGYRWYYAPEEIQETTIAREQYFSLPLLNPQTGHPVPDVFIKGRIDKLIELANGIAVKEHKSTSKSIDPDSTYWGHLNLDTQTTMYVYAARRMQLGVEGIEWDLNEPLISTVKYDVYHKPQISPKKLTQGDSKKFVADGMYCGQEFKVDFCKADIDGELAVCINGKEAEIEPGAKEGSFAIRETPDMFGARLLKDITERPEFYFRCIELTRTDAELKAFEQELYDIHMDMKFKIRSGRFWHNEKQCEATFRCDYIDQCYNRETVDPDHVPDGFRCIFAKQFGLEKLDDQS